jgi:hypothetical protein
VLDHGGVGRGDKIEANGLAGMHKESGSLKVKGQPTTLKSLPSSKNARRMSTQFFPSSPKARKGWGTRPQFSGRFSAPLKSCLEEKQDSEYLVS